MTILGSIRSQFVRFMKSPLMWFHIVSALALPLFCGFYFATSSWNTLLGTDAYIQTLGAFMPLAVAIVMAFDIETERQSGRLSTLLNVPSRAIGILGKICGYFICAMITLACCIALFALILSVSGREIVDFSTLVFAWGMLCLGSFTLYPLSTWCALRFGRNVTIALGTVFSIIAIMSVGGIAHSLVSGNLSTTSNQPFLYMLPMSWATRMATIATEHGINPSVPLRSLTVHIITAIIASGLIMLIVCLWVKVFEDRKQTDS